MARDNEQSDIETERYNSPTEMQVGRSEAAEEK